MHQEQFWKGTFEFSLFSDTRELACKSECHMPDDGTSQEASASTCRNLHKGKVPRRSGSREDHLLQSILGPEARPRRREGSPSFLSVAEWGAFGLCGAPGQVHLGSATCSKSDTYLQDWQCFPAGQWLLFPWDVQRGN